MTGPTAGQRVHGPPPHGQRISRVCAALFRGLHAAPAVPQPATFLYGRDWDFSTWQEQLCASADAADRSSGSHRSAWSTPSSNNTHYELGQSGRRRQRRQRRRKGDGGKPFIQGADDFAGLYSDQMLPSWSRRISTMMGRLRPSGAHRSRSWTSSRYRSDLRCHLMQGAQFVARGVPQIGEI